MADGAYYVADSPVHDLLSDGIKIGTGTDGPPPCLRALLDGLVELLHISDHSLEQRLRQAAPHQELHSKAKDGWV